MCVRVPLSPAPNAALSANSRNTGRGIPRGVSVFVLGSATLMDKEGTKSSAWRNGSPGGILGAVQEMGSAFEVSQALLKTLCLLGSRRPHGAPWKSKSQVLATPSRSGFECLAEFPRTKAEPSHRAPPGWGSAGGRLGGAAGRKVAEALPTLLSKPALAGTGPATSRPGGGPWALGRGCILGPLAQRSRRLPGTDSSDGGIIPQPSHKHKLPPHRVSTQHTRIALHPPLPRVAHTQSLCYATGTHAETSTRLDLTARTARPPHRKTSPCSRSPIHTQPCSHT